MSAQQSFDVEIAQVDEVVMGVVALVMLVAAVASTIALMRSRRLARARQRRRLAEAAARAAAVVRVRTELEERQAEVRARYVVTSGPPRARVLPPWLGAIDADVRRLEALETLVYDPAVWERPAAST